MNDEQTTGETDGQPPTVTELLALIARERGALEQAIDGASDDALVATPGGWSAKDHVAHVSAWERRLLAEMEGDEVAVRFGLDEATHAASDTDAINAHIHALYRDATPDQVRAEFRASGDAIRSAITAMSDADLARDVRPDDPLVDSLFDLIGWDTFRHYPQHTQPVIDLIGDA